MFGLNSWKCHGRRLVWFKLNQGPDGVTVSECAICGRLFATVRSKNLGEKEDMIVVPLDDYQNQRLRKDGSQNGDTR